MDSIIRTFDIPSGLLIDAFRTASVATSVSFSPTSDFLATSHVDSIGVFLWYDPIFSSFIDPDNILRANRAQYSDVSLQAFTGEENLEDVALPSIQGTAEDEGMQ